MIIRAVSLAIFFYSGVVMATEEPKYIIETKTEHYEIRKYNSMLVAETIVDAEFDEAGNKAFRILADYIFGNNRSKTKIAMTAPVAQQTASSSEKIAMTAPVSQIKKEKGFLVQFTMPENFTNETIPEPNDKRVHIREVEAKRFAVFKYSGSWAESRYKLKLSEFENELKTNHVVTVGEPIFARFNSPFQLWFLRRNEIWLEVVN